LMQIGGQDDLALVDASKTAKQDHAVADELMQIERAPALGARDERLGGKFRLRRRQRIDGPIVEADLIGPPVRVFAAIAPRDAAGGASRWIDLPAGFMELFGNLRPGLSATHH